MQRRSFVAANCPSRQFNVLVTTPGGAPEDLRGARGARQCHKNNMVFPDHHKRDASVPSRSGRRPELQGLDQEGEQTELCGRVRGGRGAVGQASEIGWDRGLECDAISTSPLSSFFPAAREADLRPSGRG